MLRGLINILQESLLQEERWMQKAKKRPGAVSDSPSMPIRKNIPCGVLARKETTLLNKAKLSKEETRLLRQIQLAQAFKGC